MKNIENIKFNNKRGSMQIALVVDKLLGTLTDGDIRRGFDLSSKLFLKLQLLQKLVIQKRIY